MSMDISEDSNYYEDMGEDRDEGMREHAMQRYEDLETYYQNRDIPDDDEQQELNLEMPEINDILDPDNTTFNEEEREALLVLIATYNPDMARGVRKHKKSTRRLTKHRKTKRSKGKRTMKRKGRKGRKGRKRGK